MSHAARPTALPARVLGSALAMLLLTPSLAVAAPPSDDLAALGRQEAVAVSHQVVVTWKRADLGTTKAARLTALQRASRTKRVADAAGTPARFVRPFGTQATMGIYRLDEPLGRRAGRTIDAIARIPGVESVEPDPWVTADAIPDDGNANYMWGALGPGDATVKGIATYGVNADDAWATSTGVGATVAVIDTGWVAHGDLVGQDLPGYDFIADAWSANDGDGRDADPSDPGDWIDAADSALYPECPEAASSWHGLHVSGTIAAIANNGYGTFGVAPGARIVPLRALGKCGGSMTDVADAITWASGGAVGGVPANANPVDVINLSLGGPSACPSYLQDAISGAHAAGVVVAVAAGNSATDAGAFSPANCQGTLVVAATDIAGKRSAFSNFGSIVDVAAPGAEIWSTYNGGTTTPLADDAIVAFSGTSMATPHVAGIAALLAAASPSSTPAQIEYAITHGVTSFPADLAAHSCASGGMCGIGIANAPAALASIDGIAPVVSAPSVTPRKGQKLAGTAVPVRVTWSGSDTGGSGIASYALQRSTDGGSTWTTVVTTGATSAYATQSTSGTVRFRVIATDKAGNQATGATSATTRAVLVQTSGVTFARSWSRQTASKFSGGSTKWSKTRRASASFTFTGRSIAFVTTRAATRGKMKIYVGSSLQGTFDLKGATAYRLIRWQRTWPTTGKRTIRIVVLGTAGRPRVDVDAFVVLK